MSKFKFNMEQSAEGLTVPALTAEITTEAEQLQDVLDAFGSFLKACGFQINTGEIQYVKDEDNRNE